MLNVVKHTQNAVRMNLKSSTESTEAIFVKTLKNLTLLGFSLKFQRLTPINFLYIGINRGQGLKFGKNLKNRQNTDKNIA